ncbi:MAG: CBS domain-containing protein [Desulfobacteraceae bacterium]|uniref:CBS domain-containing protein n=1 Tax=Candidatus Desulfaltia bathyphila TaxID=2841697 RepID=A0A8J6TBF9_9BACT|nr:CBS domain-containing protein [Candidatus Desulfaltia bathyphila]MBL7196233.1 CBS domain-containing protein [Desulfobacterales bacterium]
MDDKKLTVITTHINADFDALASMLAAQKLYPGSIIVFPGSHEKNLRNFFIKSMVYLFNMADIKDVDFSNIKKLVLVDTKQTSRIGKFASILKQSDLEVHIYDHHPAMANDIKGNYEVNRLTGATVSIITEIIKKKGIGLSPDEATILCLGIYEDTGSFTFSSTTETDFVAAAFLISKGANLDIVSNLIDREITTEQVGLLNDMIQAAMHYNINGIEVVATCITTDDYLPDFAFLVHKMVKMENIRVIFALALMGKKIYIVARSRMPEVDVGTILTSFEGGGHPFAASATIRDKTLAQTEHELIEKLYKSIKPKKWAKDLMSSPPIMIRSDISCKDANNFLTRYNVNALLVTGKSGDKEGKDRLVGFISRQVIEKALYHKLDYVQVKEYMTTELSVVGSDADLPEIQKKIIENKQRILPVVDDDVIKGVITRTDLLNALVRQTQESTTGLLDRRTERVHARTRNVARFMNERIPERLMNILKTSGETASEIGYNAYVAGGFVRDLFLYRANEDIDIVIEGDGIAFAKKYAEKFNARIHAHEKFGTAVIIFPDGFKIDVASARMEYYKFPAALPTVEMSSIKLDLFRRDFTVNTLAIHINHNKFGMLIDFFGAQRDIKRKSIRALHNLSFVEDPTRAFRAIRFEQRFGFTIGKLTSGLINNAVKMDFFKRLSGRRVFNELRQILEEENPVPAVKRLYDYNLLKVIHPSIGINEEVISLLNSVKKVLSWHDLLFLDELYMKWIVYFLALVRHCDDKTSDEICTRFELSPRHKTIICKERFQAEKCLLALERTVSVKDSFLYKQICGFKTELILYMMAVTKQKRIKKSISRYFTKLRYITTSVTGKQLIKMGLKPGPIYREILEAVLYAKLDGKLKTANDELKFARNYVSKF